jgi:ABC-2 type transport system permease protein
MKSLYFAQPCLALWSRDMVRFLRQRNRIIGALATPLVFWLLLGLGFTPSFRPGETGESLSYLVYFFPGTLVLIMLFTAIFSTISVIEDRREGFLQSVLVSPVRLSAIVSGKLLAGTCLAVLQALLFCLLAPAAGIPIPWSSLPMLLAAFTVVSFGMTGLGFLVAWPMSSTQGFHALMNVFLMPLWMLSGALFPVPSEAGALWWLYICNPVSYGVALIRSYLLPPEILAEIPGLPPVGWSWLVSIAFGLTLFLVGLLLVRIRRIPPV